MKKEKRKHFTSVIQALDFIDDLRKKKVVPYLHTLDNTGFNWEVIYKLKEK